MRRVGLGGDHDAAGVLVQPVDDPRPRHPADAREAGAAVVDKGVDQGPRLAARRRVGRHPGRLVDDDQMGVLEEHGERDILRLRVRRQDVGRDQPVDARMGFCRGVGHGRALARYRALQHQCLHPGPRHIRQGVGQGAVEPWGGRG